MHISVLELAISIQFLPVHTTITKLTRNDVFFCPFAFEEFQRAISNYIATCSISQLSKKQPTENLTSS